MQWELLRLDRDMGSSTRLVATIARGCRLRAACCRACPGVSGVTDSVDGSPNDLDLLLEPEL